MFSALKKVAETAEMIGIAALYVAPDFDHDELPPKVAFWRSLGLGGSLFFKTAKTERNAKEGKILLVGLETPGKLLCP